MSKRRKGIFLMDLIRVSNLLKVNVRLIFVIMSKDKQMVRLLDQEVLNFFSYRKTSPSGGESVKRYDIIKKNFGDKVNESSHLVDRCNFLMIDLKSDFVSPLNSDWANKTVLSEAVSLCLEDEESKCRKISSIIERYMKNEINLNNERTDWYGFGKSAGNIQFQGVNQITKNNIFLAIDQTDKFDNKRDLIIISNL
jgi:hypothetical protein